MEYYKTRGLYLENFNINHFFKLILVVTIQNGNFSFMEYAAI